MIIEMNEDIEKYEETVMMGLTAQQTIFSGLAVGAGAGIVCLLYFKAGMSMMLSCYAAIPVVMPIALMGFYQYNGMNFFQFFFRFIKSFGMSRPLLYRSTESMKAYQTLSEQSKEGAKKKTKKKIQYLFSCLV